MRRTIIVSGIIACIFTVSFVAHATAQNGDTRALMMADITKASGEYCLYDFDLPAPTPAPKGYKPFYISHYGRHGSRYALPDNVYEWMRDLLEKAHADGKLTPKGEALYARYMDFYPRVAYRGGELTQKGQWQHRRIAGIMFRDYREVFRGKTHVEAVSTHYPRVIMSMSAFLDELDDLDKSISVRTDAGKVFLTTLLPASKDSPGYSKRLASAQTDLSKKYFDSLIRPAVFCTRFFTDTAYVNENFGMWKFHNYLRTIVVDIPSLDFVPEYGFDDIFTDEELYHLWKYRNYNGYLYMGRAPGGDRNSCMASGATVKEIILNADKDMESGRTQVRLRFGHDTGLLPLLSFLKVNKFGLESADADEIENNYHSFDIVMAANLQLIFYRSKRNPEILVKCLFNGRDATLPFPAAVGPYYSWSAFKAYYMPLITAAEKRFLAE